ncbi:MAG: hypothetical protein ACYTAF_14760, partial [Planctomycetota bacterium]
MRRFPLAAVVLLAVSCGSEAPPPKEVDDLSREVEESVGWKFTSAPGYKKAGPARLRSHIRKRITSGPGSERLAALGRALCALEILPPGYSLADGLMKAYGEEVAALYDMESRKILATREALKARKREEDAHPRDEKFRGVLAHVLVNALQHQNNKELELLLGDDPDTDDVAAAFHALMEGEATLHAAELGSDGALSPMDVPKIVGHGANERLGGEPALVRRMIYVPYVAGANYVLRRMHGEIRGSGPRLHKDLPLSTEQIFHPERTTEKDPPVAVFLPDLSDRIGGGRSLVFEGVLGDAILGLVIPKRPDYRVLNDGLSHSHRWDGDRIQLYEKKGGGDPVVVLVTCWDDVAAAASAQSATEIPPGSVGTVVLSGKTLAIVAGLAGPEAEKIGRLALGSAVMKPFRSVEELREHRKNLKFPSAPKVADPVAALVEEIRKEKDPEALQQLLKSWGRSRDSVRTLLLAVAKARTEGVEVEVTRAVHKVAEFTWSDEEILLLIRGGMGAYNTRSEFAARYMKMFLEDASLEGKQLGLYAGKVAAALQEKELLPVLEKAALRTGFARGFLTSVRGGTSHRAYLPLKPAVRAGLVTPHDFGSRLRVIPRQFENEVGGFIQAFLEALTSGKVEWSQEDQKDILYLFEAATPFEVPAGVLAASKGFQQATRGHIVSWALSGPERDAAFRLLLEDPGLLKGLGKPISDRLFDDPEVAELFLKFIDESGKKAV